MAQRESQTERAEKSVLPNLLSSEFATMGKKRIEDFVDAQKQLLEKLQESNKRWLARVQSEAGFASEFATKLTSARSIPDAATACQVWSSRRLEMMAEDGKHVFADAQMFMETGARLLSNGWGSKGRDGLGT
jgi:hypothetical protein